LYVFFATNIIYAIYDLLLPNITKEAVNMSKTNKANELEVRRKINYLVQQAKQGNTEASEELLSLLKSLILATIKRNYFGNGPYWEDLFQEASLSILEGVRNYDEQRGIPFLAYIKTKLKFDIYNLCRSERTLGSRILEYDKEDQDPLDSLIDYTANPQEDLLSKEQTAAIADALNNLDPKQREVVEQFFLQKRTLKEVAITMGISYKTAQRYKTRALEALVKLLGKRL
jgi:RNA polymerase sporulation-specific sigma factor